MFPTELQPPRAPHHAPRRGGGNLLGSLGTPRTGSPYSFKTTYFDKTDRSGGGNGCLALSRLIWRKSDTVFSFRPVTSGCPRWFAVHPEPLGES